MRGRVVLVVAGDRRGFHRIRCAGPLDRFRPLAEAAKRTGKILAVAPISARERRQIHLALVDEEGVSTRSEGEGIFRQLLIVPGPKPKGQRSPRPAGA